MGCRNGKVQHDPQVGNGKAFPTSKRKVSEQENDLNRKVALVDGVVEKDPRSPLDSRQAFKVKQSWKGIKRNMEDTGVEMFLSKMGCRNTKVAKTATSENSDFKRPARAVNGGGFSSVTDTSKTFKALGVSAKDAFKLNQSWKAIKRNMEETGVEMFVRLFKSNAHLQTMFQGFKHLHSDDELRSNEALEHHATLVMTTLDDAITHIDNFDYVKEVLCKTGASHVRFDGFSPDNFWKIKEPFLEAVKITLGDRYTENMESIYKTAITFILQTMSEGIQEQLDLLQNKKPSSES